MAECVEGRFQPTVLMYELFTPDDKDFADVPDKRLFEFDANDVSELVSQASEAFFGLDQSEETIR